MVIWRRVHGPTARPNGRSKGVWHSLSGACKVAIACDLCVYLARGGWRGGGESVSYAPPSRRADVGPAGASLQPDDGVVRGPQRERRRERCGRVANASRVREPLSTSCHSHTRVHTHLCHVVTPTATSSPTPVPRVITTSLQPCVQPRREPRRPVLPPSTLRTAFTGAMARHRLLPAAPDDEEEAQPTRPEPATVNLDSIVAIAENRKCDKSHRHPLRAHWLVRSRAQPACVRAQFRARYRLPAHVRLLRRALRLLRRPGL